MRATCAGLIGVKFAITASASRYFGLSKAESIKVGLTLSQGGEFAFVLLELARQLEILPAELNSMLIIVVVMSMALTPLLAELGDTLEQKETEVQAKGRGRVVLRGLDRRGGSGCCTAVCARTVAGRARARRSPPPPPLGR